MRAIARLDATFRTDITIDEHKLVADEPADAGGKSDGPTAMGLLAAALGACTAATLRSYANLKGLPLDSVEVDVEIHRRKPSELKEAGEGTKGTVATKRITITGDKLTNDQRVRMLEIAEKCPVNRALSEGVDFI